MKYSRLTQIYQECCYFPMQDDFPATRVHVHINSRKLVIIILDIIITSRAGFHYIGYSFTFKQIQVQLVRDYNVKICQGNHQIRVCGDGVC